MKQTVFLLVSIFTVIASNAQTLLSEDDYRIYFSKKNNELDPIEGIWSINMSGTSTIITQDGKPVTNGNDFPNYQKVAIVKNNNKYILLELSTSRGNVSGVLFEPTATNIYLFKTAELGQSGNAFLKNAGTILEYEEKRNVMPAYIKEMFHGDGFSYESINTWTFSMTTKFTLVKVYPTATDYTESKKNKTDYISSGTGFAISNAGYIVTNHHVIEGANSITIKGVNGNFNNKIKATIVADDKNNDIAIIKLEPGNLIAGTIPYLIASKSSTVGIDVFALGYPLRATMGDEVKLTNGIISANSGYQGDITKYQISVPVQPGNSGGPLISSQGYLIGIVNAKHLETENVSYAIKSTYIQSLISTLPSNIAIPQTNLLAGKTLSQKVELVKQYVYIIEGSH